MDFRRGHWLQMVPRISWRDAMVSAGFGVYVHAILDAIMHPDAQPWWPFVSGNPLLGIISVGALHQLCIALGVFGIIALTGIWLLKLFVLPVRE